MLTHFSFNRRKYKMKKLIATSAIALSALAATSASAQLLEVGGLSFGGDVTFDSNLDAGTSMVTISPELSYGLLSGLDLMVSSDLEMYNNTDGFVFGDDNIVLEFGAEYIVWDDLVFSLSTSYDLEAELQGDVNFSLTYSF